MTTFRARFYAAITAAVLLAACGDGATVTAPDQALFDGGHTFGGGNRSDTTTTTTASSGEGAVANSGGHTFGGGN
jgi:ABC-type glycerol-3-phosphate transport system substrate-binding protein